MVASKAKKEARAEPVLKRKRLGKEKNQNKCKGGGSLGLI